MSEAANSTDKLPISYHTFIYPFSYGKSSSGENLYSYIQDKVYKNRTAFWKELEFRERNPVLRYNEYQYFFPKARAVFCPEDKSLDGQVLLKRYTYNLNSDARFEIWLKEDKKYELSINQIVLELFSEPHIGILTFELENYNTYSEEEIIKINEYGRRVFSACVAADKAGNLTSILTAAKLTISGLHIKNAPESGLVEIDFNRHLKDKVWEKTPEISLAERVLFEGAPEAQWKGCIHPVLDDRMYVVCLMRKNQYEPIVNDFSGYRYLHNQTYAEHLYKFIFLESGDSTCQNVDMMREKLEEHVYRRWTDWGTVHGVTEYSFVCVTGEDPDLMGAVINPFLTMYTSMAKLVLIQRAAITQMEEEAQAAALNLEKKADQKTGSEEAEIKNLWKKYVLFQNKLLIPQVTFQEQGVELYEMLVRFLKIREMNAYLENELQNLFNYAQMEKAEQEKKRADKIDKKINILTVAGIVLASFSLAEDIYSSLAITLFGNGQSFSQLIVIGVKIAAYIIAIFVMYKQMQRPKEDLWAEDGSLLGYFKPVLWTLFVLLIGFILLELLTGLIQAI